MEPIKEDIIDTRKENAVLACLITFPDYIFDFDISSGDFFNSATRDIFCVLDEIRKRTEVKNTPLDFSLIKIDETAKLLGIQIDLEHIKTLRGSTSKDGYVDVNSMQSYVQDLKESRLRQNLIKAADEIKILAGNNNLDINEVVAKSENLIISTDESYQGKSEPVQIECGGDEQLKENIANFVAGKKSGIQTGYPVLDYRFGGLNPGSLTVIAGGFKAAKSLLEENMVVNIFNKYGNEYPTLVFDTELPTWEYRERWWGINIGVNSRRIHDGALTKEELDRLQEFRTKSKSYSLHHEYIPSFTIDYLVKLARKFKNSHGIKLVVFDLFKLPEVSSLKTAHEWQSIGFLADALKNKIAGKLDIAVLACAQLNSDDIKALERGESGSGVVGGSIRITQYCSSLFTLRSATRKEMSLEGDKLPEWKRYGKYGNKFLQIKATRNGGDGTSPIPLYFNNETLRIIESRDVIPDGSDKPLSETVGRQISREDISSTSN